MSKDWTGNSKAIYSCHGASNHSDTERESNDFYATDPLAVELLLEREKFFPYVWECACGKGHISQVLKEHGYEVKSSDLYDRGYEGTEVIDFLSVKKNEIKNDKPRDIITNPPYKYAKDFVEHALDISMDGTKVAMFLKLTFLESKSRIELFRNNPPKTVYVFSNRMKCAKNGDFESTVGSAVAYCWYVWEKGFKGNPIIKWI